MIVVLKNGNRVYYEGKEPDDKSKLLNGILLCVIKYDNNFSYSFYWNDVTQTY